MGMMKFEFTSSSQLPIMKIKASSEDLNDEGIMLNCIINFITLAEQLEGIPRYNSLLDDCKEKTKKVEITTYLIFETYQRLEKFLELIKRSNQ